jgi:hypothetical protein
VQAAAHAYLDALVSHHAAAIPLAANARRIENRRVHGANAAQIRAEIQSASNRVTGVSDARIWVEGDEAVAMYRILTTQVDRAGLGGQVLGATRFRVDNGRISQIESICSSSKLCGTTR